MFEQERAARIAASFRQEAREQEKQLELARRLYNAKMRRLENGEKRKRGCCPLKRALRADNAVIAMREATIQCSLWQCRAGLFHTQVAKMATICFNAKFHVLKLSAG